MIINHPDLGTIEVPINCLSKSNGRGCKVNTLEGVSVSFDEREHCHVASFATNYQDMARRAK